MALSHPGAAFCPELPRLEPELPRLKPDLPFELLDRSLKRSHPHRPRGGEADAPRRGVPRARGERGRGEGGGRD